MASLARIPAAAATLLGLATAAVLIALAPLLVRSDYALFLLTQAAVLYLVALGLNFLTGYVGITSIGHGALVAIGAYATGIATVDHGWPFWAGMALAILATSLAGFLLALPAFRLSTWYFALITLGFGSVVSGLIMELGWLTHGFSGIVNVPLPEFFNVKMTHRSLFWFVAGTGFVAFLITRNLIGSRIGRAMLAVKESPLTAVSSGVRIGAVKIGAFVFSAALAGIAGAYFAANQSVITPDDFTIHFSIFFLLVIVLGGLGNLHGPLVGTAAFFLLPYLMTGLSEWRLLIYATGLLFLTIMFPKGLVGLLTQVMRPLIGQKPRTIVPDAGGDIPVADNISVSIRNVHISFGGVHAVNDVSLDVPAGTIHGIIGPNGSGKTTLVNLICGFYEPDHGSITIGGMEAVGVAPDALARAGVRRTFQTPKLIPDLSILDNVVFGAYADEKASVLSLALALPPARREAARLRAQAMRYIDFVGLASQADAPAGEIPHGQRRLAEIARALAGRPRLLLLDEPAAGLSLAELDSLQRVIAAIARSGTTVIIVEHHLELISSLCARVSVLDRGRLVREGTPAEVFADPEVLAIYMGRRAVKTVNAA